MGIRKISWLNVCQQHKQPRQPHQLADDGHGYDSGEGTSDDVDDGDNALMKIRLMMMKKRKMTVMMVMMAMMTAVMTVISMSMLTFSPGKLIR